MILIFDSSLFWFRNFCKQRVGSVHVLIQQSPISVSWSLISHLFVDLSFFLRTPWVSLFPPIVIWSVIILLSLAKWEKLFKNGNYREKWAEDRLSRWVHKEINIRRETIVISSLDFRLSISSMSICSRAGISFTIREVWSVFIPHTLSPVRIQNNILSQIFAKELYSAFSTRIWLTLSEKRVAFRSNAHLSCEFPVGERLHLTVFTFQVLPNH